MSTKEHIFKLSTTSLKERREYTLFNKVIVIIKDPLKEINMTNVIKYVEKYLPREFVYGLDSIYVGNFKELNDREVESIYLDGAIFISNNQTDEKGMASSIVHEVAHSLEEQFGEDIYGDNEIIDEFISKRKKLKSLLHTQGFEYKDSRIFYRTEHNHDFDNFLYKEVGYDRLNQLVSGIFLQAYACTSLREYFSNGFEHYFMGENEYLQKVSPKLYKKIYSLTKEI